MQKYSKYSKIEFIITRNKRCYKNNIKFITVLKRNKFESLDQRLQIIFGFIWNWTNGTIPHSLSNGASKYIETGHASYTTIFRSLVNGKEFLRLMLRPWFNSPHHCTWAARALLKVHQTGFLLCPLRTRF